MNTSASTSTTATHSHAQAALGRASNLRGHGAPSAGNDLFAQLLLLMGADAETATGSALATVADADTAALPGAERDAKRPTEDRQDPLNQALPGHPLLDLPGWIGQPTPTWSQSAAPARADADAAANVGLNRGAGVGGAWANPTAAERAAAASMAATPTTAPSSGTLPIAAAAAPALATDAAGENTAAQTSATASSAAAAAAFSAITREATPAPSATTTANAGAATNAATDLPTATGPATGPANGLANSPATGQPQPAAPAVPNADARMALGLTSAGADGATSAPQMDHRAPAAALPALGAQVFAWRSTTTMASGARTAAALTPAATAAAQASAHSAAAERVHAGGTPAHQHAAAVHTHAGAVWPGEREFATDRESRSGPSGASDRTDARHDTGAITTDAGAATYGLGGEVGAGGAGTQERSNPGDASDTRTSQGADDRDAPGGPWGAQHLRHASVRVGEAGDSSIDIQLAMNGQELQVDFSTNDEEARTQLAQDAGAVLGDLLERSGIELGAVSVGGQGPQARQDNPGQTPQPPQPPRASAAQQRPAGAEAEHRTAAPAARMPRADGSRPLDLFA